MLRFISQWRMKNQLKLYFLLLSAFSTFLLALLLGITQSLVNKQIEVTTQQISTKITERDVQRQFSIQTQIFYDVINRNYQTLDKIAVLYHFVLTSRNLSTYETDQCPKNQSASYRISNICYNIYNFSYGQQLNKTQQQALDIYIKHQSLLEETLLLFDPEQYIVGNWSIGYANQFYFYAYQAIGFYSNFNIGNRPFYKNHVAKANTSMYIFSDVFYNFEGQYKVTISKNLTSDVVDGIAATQFEFTIIKKFFQENFLILNKDGMVLIGNTKNYFQPNKTNLFVFNVSITGFDSSDWASIQQYINNNITDSNCSQTDYSFLCRQNKITQRDVIIFVKYLKFSNLILLIFKDIIQDVDLDNQLVLIKEKTYDLIMQVVLYQLIVAFGTSIIAIFVVIYICRYMTFLEKLATNHFQNKPVDLKAATFMRQLKQSTNSHSTNIIWNLSDLYYKLILQLTEKPFNKNLECKIFESFKFPLRKKFKTIELIKESIATLRNRRGLIKVAYRPMVLELIKNRNFSL